MRRGKRFRRKLPAATEQLSTHEKAGKRKENAIEREAHKKELKAQLRTKKICCC
jgi:hypothetical protein